MAEAIFLCIIKRSIITNLHDFQYNRILKVYQGNLFQFGPNCFIRLEVLLINAYTIYRQTSQIQIKLSVVINSLFFCQTLSYTHRSRSVLKVASSNSIRVLSTNSFIYSSKNPLKIIMTTSELVSEKQNKMNE